MKDLTEGNEARQIFFFAIPMLIGNVFQQGYNLIDAVVVGNFVGKDALAAVGASFPILFVIVFKWGVGGTAWATVISQSTSFIVVFAYLNRTHEVVKVNLRTIRFDVRIFRQGLRIGLPNGLQQMLVGLGAMVPTITTVATENTGNERGVVLLMPRRAAEESDA